MPGAGTPDPSFPRPSFRAEVVGRIFPQYPPPAPYLRLAFNRIGYHPFDPVLLLAIVVVLRLRLRPRRWRRHPVRRVIVGILIVPIVIVVVPIVPVVVVVVVVYFVVDVRTLPASLVDVEYLLETTLPLMAAGKESVMSGSELRAEVEELGRFRGPGINAIGLSVG